MATKANIFTFMNKRIKTENSNRKEAKNRYHVASSAAYKEVTSVMGQKQSSNNRMHGGK